MNFARRFEIIFESSVGSLLIFFFFVLVLLLGIYFILRLRQRRLDALAYYYQEHYEKVAAVTGSKFQYLGRHKADILGRKTIVTKDDDFFLCLAPPPDLFDQKACERFRFYERAVQHHKLPLFSRYHWTYADEDLFISLQDRLLNKDGRMLPSLREYFLDRKLGLADGELILLEIARALASLHELKTEQGEQLYYGLLSPRSIHIAFDSRQRINEIVLPHHGLYFACSKKVLSARFDQIAKNEIQGIIENQSLKDCFEELHYLSPEQKDVLSGFEVSAASDFYSFAVLAISLLTQKDYQGASFDIKDLPEKWRGFIQACLDKNPDRRPKDFLELQDRLYDPDLALTHHQSEEDSTDEFLEDDDLSLNELKDVLHSAKKESLGPSKDSYQKLKKLARQNLSYGKWSVAKKHLLEANEQKSSDAEVLVGLSIVYYEEGLLKEAEDFYQKAKAIDVRLAKRFREHIAFRV